MKATKFLSNYLKSEQIEKPMVLTITKIVQEEVGFGDKKQKKAVMYFKEVEQGLVLNKTNVRFCVTYFGTDEMDNWVGRQVYLCVRDVPYQGKMETGLRLEAVPAPSN